MSHTSAAGTAVITYPLAVRRPYVGSGTNAQDTDFIQCVAFGRVGEFAAKYLHKGQRIIVEGRLQTSRYVDKDGITRYSTQVVVARHEFADAPRANSASAAPATPATDTPAPAADEMTNIVEEDEDLPF